MKFSLSSRDLVSSCLHALSEDTFTTDLPDSTVHRRRRYRRTTTSKQASSEWASTVHSQDAQLRL